jgi:heme-binding NEAT domain protein
VVLAAYHKPKSIMAHINVLMAFKYNHDYACHYSFQYGTQNHADSTVIKEVSSQASAALQNVLSHVSCGFP